MVSTFGIISLVVASVAICALIMHFKLMKKRTGVDDAAVILTEALDAMMDEPIDAIRAYNDAVDAYNFYISKYPGKIMALLVGFEKEARYESD